ncbi:MAG: glycosyltransferase family 9 protein [Syntrophobacteraceae bacterium]
MMRAVVFHQGALGDFLAAAAVLDGLCRSCPGLHIDFWSKPEHVALLAGKSYVGECFSLDGPLIPSLLRDDLWRTTVLPDFLLQSEQVFILGQKGSQILAARLSERLKARVDWIQSFPEGDKAAVHVCDFIATQLHELGWKPVKTVLTLVPATREMEAARELLREQGINSPPIFIHPGSGGTRKVWPLKNWHALLGWIKSVRPAPVILSVGPADGYMNDFAGAMRAEGVPVLMGLSLVRLAALLACCRIYIGSDSGVSHLAAATGATTVAVFGPTAPAVWGPRGRDVRVLQRTWGEGEVLAWNPSDRVASVDKEITSVICTVIANEREIETGKARLLSTSQYRTKP